MKGNDTPLDGKTLFNDCWVFLLYGLALGFFVMRYDNLGADMTDLTNLIMEPMSIHTFAIISMCGFLLVSLGVVILECIYGYSVQAIRNNWLMRNILIPISEVGLSTGAIIIGLMLGMAISFSIRMPDDSYSKLADNCFIIAICIALVFWPLFWMQRSMLATSGRENRFFNILGISYIGVIGFLAYNRSFEMFVSVSAISILVTGLAFYLFVTKNKKDK